MKSIARWLFLVTVLPLAGLVRLNGSLFGKSRAFSGCVQLMSLFPGLAGEYLRHAFLSWVARKCGPDACISFGTLFSHPTVSIGRSVYIGPYCVIGNVTLEDDVLIGSHVSIMNGCQQHGIERLDIPIREQPGKWPHITIGRDTWIGDRAVIMADVGKHCVIGAGSVVTQPIPDYAIAVGVPARVVKDRTQLRLMEGCDDSCTQAYFGR